MNVLVSTTPGAGHVHPLVPLAEALQRAGHAVTWATASESCDRVESFGFTAVPAGMSSARRLAGFAEQCPEAASATPRQHRGYAYRVMFGVIAAPQMFADLGAVFDNVRPDVVLHDPSELGAAPVAAGRGIPHVGVGFGDLIPDALLAATAPEVAALWSAVGQRMPASCGLYEHLYVHQFPPSLSRPDAAARLSTVRPMRPLAFDGRADDLEPAWTGALGVDRPCIYATFGTEFAGRAPFGSLLDALEPLPVDVVLTLGPRVDAAALGRVPANVRVEQYVPQTYVLARSAAMISHAGSGAVLGAAERGLPHLCLPIAADQFDNADAVSGCGAGLIIEPDAIDPVSLRSAIERLLDDEDLLRGGADLAGEIAAMPFPDDLVQEIEALVR